MPLSREMVDLNANSLVQNQHKVKTVVQELVDLLLKSTTILIYRALGVSRKKGVCLADRVFSNRGESVPNQGPDPKYGDLLR